MERQSERDDRCEERPAVLIPYGYTSGYQCLRSFGRRGIRTILGVSEGNAPEAASRYCNETVRLPEPDDDLLAYRDALARIAARRDVRTLVPLREADVYVLSRYREMFEEHINFIVPPFESLKTVQDRLRLASAAEAADVPVPETRRLNDVEDVDRKLVVKSRYNILTDEYVDSLGPSDGHEVNQIEYIGPSDDVDVGAVREKMNHVPIVQEFVPRANEYMVGALCDNGELLATMQLHQIRENSYAGGGGVYRKSVYVDELADLTQDLLGHLDWHGLACIEYMEDADTGEFKVAEINPRLWQSLPPAVRAGADFPYYYWLHSSGNPDRIKLDYEVGVGTHFLRGELGHVSSIVKEDCPFVDPPSLGDTLWNIALSCYDDPYFDYLHLDDPMPFLSDAYSILGQVTAKVSR